MLMAVYKVLQDIEAEEKFVGPLTLKQFILAGITFVCGYVSFYLLSHNLWILTLPILPVMLATGFLAFPWGRDQSTEVWLLAKLRFHLKPRRRIWDQTGMQELVTITAPKHLEQYTSDNLSQTEVKSRLHALADTLDSRGWAVKNVNVNLFNQPSATEGVETDRLINMSNFTHEVPSVDINAADDILDEHNNPTAQHLDQMISQSSKTHRKAAMETLHEARRAKPAHKKASRKKYDSPQPDFWFMHQPAQTHLPKGSATFDNTNTIAPTSSNPSPSVSSHTGQLTPDEQAFLNEHPSQKNKYAQAYGNTKVIQPGAAKLKTKKSQAKHPPNRDNSTSSKPLNPAILELANNDDLTVATIARQAKKSEPEPPSNEVVIPLR